jgi:pyruvate/2-oxoglutarate dehydrogenase complex dihydrolipoamide dehydrogenase (E3) component
VAAYIAATLKARVTLIERDKMGGDCLYRGCVPSKALIRSARLLAQIARAREYGLRQASAEFDFGEVMERVQRVIRAVEPHDSIERYEGLGVECLRGEARLVSPYEVDIDGMRLSTRSIVIATGARPLIPPIPGLTEMNLLSSDTVWGLRVLPRRLLVLGGGPIGCELAQAFRRFGSEVTQVELLPRLLPREDPEISERVMARFTAEGIDLRVGHRPIEFRREGRERVLLCEHAGGEIRIGFDTVLVAVGRAANTAGLGLEALGIPLAENGTVEADAFLGTPYPNIYVCGDAVGPYQFTHVAAHQAWYAAVNALLGGLHRFRVDYSAIPYAVFTDPEIARVGLNEAQARERGIAYEVTRYGIEDLDRAITDGEADGLVKVLTIPGRDRILGATIVGTQAAEVIAELVAAMRHGFGLNQVLRTIHIYPTLAEANKYAAGAWRRAHAPKTLLAWLERYHAWRLGGERKV